MTLAARATLPVSILTGFLGSGKTTLLGHLLKSPQFSRTAVIINEFGEIGLDHELVEASDESFIQLQTGCLCCAIRGDLVLTLESILNRRDADTVPLFDQIVIETSGLADPAPILHALMMDSNLSSRLRLAGLVATVDAVNGHETLRRQPEAVKQIALADRLILTKSDLVNGTPDALIAELSALNPSAPLLTATHGVIDPERLFDGGLVDRAGKLANVAAWLDDGHHHGQNHNSRISCYTLVRETPVQAVTLTLLLETLAEHCGGDLLRLKAIVNVAEFPDRPAVIHGVQHVFHPPVWLERWPSSDRRSRFVFIVRAIPRAWIEALIEALDAEVREVNRPALDHDAPKIVRPHVD
jgi:G3E family GTPase